MNKQRQQGFTPLKMGCQEQPVTCRDRYIKASSSLTGFTILEIVMSLGVFIVGFVSVMSLFTGGYRTQQIATARVAENLIAENIIASLKEPEIPGLKTSIAGVTGPTATSILTSSDFPGFCYFYTMAPYGTGSQSADYYRLKVSVHVFEKRFKPLFEMDTTGWTPAQLDAHAAELARNKVVFHTIIDKD